MQEDRDEEQHEQHNGVPCDGSNRDNSQADQRCVVGVLSRGERLDEEVRDAEDDCGNERQEDLRDENRRKRRTSHVSRELLRGMTEALFLESSDSRT